MVPQVLPEDEVIYYFENGTFDDYEAMPLSQGYPLDLEISVDEGMTVFLRS